jgi:hypothetical protein
MSAIRLCQGSQGSGIQRRAIDVPPYVRGGFGLSGLRVEIAQVHFDVDGSLSARQLFGKRGHSGAQLIVFCT